MNAITFAGPAPRTDEKALHADNYTGTNPCEVCHQRDADGVLPDGRNVCETCAHRLDGRNA